MGLFGLVVAALVGLMVLSTGASVSAHSFLVSTSPAQGQRLAGAPDAVVLVFSESVDERSTSFLLRREPGGPVGAAVAAVSADGLEVRVPVVELADGIYVVEWSAFSALDGHGSAGEFAFSVGDDTGELPAADARSTSDMVETAATWVFFAGLSAAVGALWLGLMDAGFGERPIRRTASTGLAIAALAVAVVVIGSNGTRSVLPLLWCLQALLVAFIATRAPRLRWVALGAVVLAGGLWSSRHHAAAANGLVGSLIDTAHLLSAAGWVGGLAVIVVMAWSSGAGDHWREVASRYSRVAPGLVAVTTVTGVISAWALVPSWASLTATGYGRLVSVKAVLLLVAVVLAVVARWLLRRRRGPLLRSAASAESLCLVAALVVAGFLVGGVPPQSVTATEALLGPDPLRGAISRGAGMAGRLNVWVATDGSRLDVTVSSPSGPVRGTSVEITQVNPDGVEVGVEPRPCGPGCFTSAVELAGGSAMVRVAAAAPDWIGGTFSAEIIRPPGPLAVEVLDDVLTRMREVAELRVTEIVSSGPGAVTAPGTVTMSGAEFIATQPYASGNVDEVRLVSAEPERLVLFVPGSQIFAELELDRDRRIRSSRMVTPGHEILDEFSYDP